MNRMRSPLLFTRCVTAIVGCGASTTPATGFHCQLLLYSLLFACSISNTPSLDARAADTNIDALDRELEAYANSDTYDGEVRDTRVDVQSDVRSDPSDARVDATLDTRADARTGLLLSSEACDASLSCDRCQIVGTFRAVRFDMRLTQARCEQYLPDGVACAFSYASSRQTITCGGRVIYSAPMISDERHIWGNACGSRDDTHDHYGFFMVGRPERAPDPYIFPEPEYVSLTGGGDALDNCKYHFSR